MQLSEQAIEAQGEACSNAELFRRVAARMGLEDACLRASDDEMIDDALNSGHAFLEGITREKLEAEHWMELKVPRGRQDGARICLLLMALPRRAARRSSTARRWRRRELEPVAAFTAPVESRHSVESRRYPLELLARKHDNFLNTTFCNLEGHQKMERRFELQMNAVDAARRGIAEGDAVRVHNDRGELRLTARVDDSVPPGVVGAYLDWARPSPGGKNINALTSDRLADMGGGATFYSVLVEVEKAVG